MTFTSHKFTNLNNMSFNRTKGTVAFRMFSISNYHNNRPANLNPLLLKLLSPVLSPLVDLLNKLREQSAHTLVENLLEVLNSLLIVEIQPKLLLHFHGLQIMIEMFLSLEH